MNVVHGVITAGGRLACWAETTPGSGSGFQRRPRRAVPHPFATLPPLAGAVGTADVALPTVGSRPAPSPELSAGAVVDTARTMLWTVPVVYVAAGADLEPLPVVEPDALDPGGAAATGPGQASVDDVRPGASIGALTDLVTFATDLVRRGRVLPNLLDHPIEARWQPVLWADDAVTFEALWRAMPGVACAAGDWTAEEAVRAALDFQVDALVRAALGDRPIVADGQVRQDGTVRAWLAALTGPDATLRERPTPPTGAGPHRHDTDAGTQDPVAAARAGTQDPLAAARADMQDPLAAARAGTQDPVIAARPSDGPSRQDRNAGPSNAARGEQDGGDTYDRIATGRVGDELGSPHSTEPNGEHGAGDRGNNGQASDNLTEPHPGHGQNDDVNGRDKAHGSSRHPIGETSDGHDARHHGGDGHNGDELDGLDRSGDGHGNGGFRGPGHGDGDSGGSHGLSSGGEGWGGSGLAGPGRGDGDSNGKPAGLGRNGDGRGDGGPGRGDGDSSGKPAGLGHSRDRHNGGGLGGLDHSGDGRGDGGLGGPGRGDGDNSGKPAEPGRSRDGHSNSELSRLDRSGDRHNGSGPGGLGPNSDGGPRRGDGDNGGEPAELGRSRDGHSNDGLGGLGDGDSGGGRGLSGGGGGRGVRESTDVRRVRDVVRRWVASGRPAAVRLCFRLTFVEEFDDGGDGAAPEGLAGVRVDDGPDASGWLVEFLLQPVAEPGLLVPAHDVWLDASSPLFRWVDYPQDVLLEDLGRASRLWPELDEALHQARPERLRLDTIGAYGFLRHAGMLHDAGFGVLLPAQWQRRQDLGLTLTTHTAQPAAPVLRDTTANRDAIVRYRWGLAIGDEFLSEADLQELARAKVPLVRLRGRWVHLDRDRLRAGLAFLARGGQGHMSAGEAMRLVRLVPEGDLPLPVTGVDGTGWLADLLTGRAVERLELLDPPASLATTLRPYQRKGLSWLAFLDGLGVGALLADDMGLGKTVQVLALEALLRERGPRPPTLIVCPLSVLGNWRREIERFTPGLRVAVHHGTERALRGDVDLVLTTYQVATRDVDRLAAKDWDRIVLDEAQHVKNSTSAAARAVREIPARHRVALTGTPVENRLTELWSIADFLNPGLLGPASIFRARYSVPVERYADADAAARLRRVTRPFLLRRVKTDRAVIADLPDKLERRQWCNLTLEQATLYKAVVDELFVKLREGRAGDQRKGLVLSAMTKLKQVCNHPAHLMGDGTPLAGRSGKLARLEEILATALDAGDRALVFTQFAKFGHLLTPYLAARLGTAVEFLHGGTAKGARDAMVERFQSGTGPGVLLLSLKAGGTGLNLTAANHVVHVDRWWNPATEQQATDRAFRIGQRRDVQVHTFVCVGTIEERVDTVMAEKRTLAGVAVGSGEGWLTGLSTDDLLDLMTLRPEATDE